MSRGITPRPYAKRTKKAKLDGTRPNKEVEISLRRSQIYLYMSRGISRVEMATALGVSIQTIGKDIHDMKKDWGTSVRDADGNEEIGALFADSDHVKEEAFSQYDQADKPALRAVFLDKVIKAIALKFKILIDTGIIPHRNCNTEQNMVRLLSDFSQPPLHIVKLVGLGITPRNETKVEVKDVDAKISDPENAGGEDDDRKSPPISN